MSDDKNKRVKINMSFEDALKKAATTKVNPAIMIEGKGKEYEIPGAAGKKVQFVQIVISEGIVGHFILKARVKSPNNLPQVFSIPLMMDPNQKRDETVFISHPAISVPANGSLMISVETITNEDFEVGSVMYKVLT